MVYLKFGERQGVDLVNGADIRLASFLRNSAQLFISSRVP